MRAFSELQRSLTQCPVRYSEASRKCLHFNPLVASDTCFASFYNNLFTNTVYSERNIGKLEVLTIYVILKGLVARALRKRCNG